MSLIRKIGDYMRFRLNYALAAYPSDNYEILRRAPALLFFLAGSILLLCAVVVLYIRTYPNAIVTNVLPMIGVETVCVVLLVKGRYQASVALLAAYMACNTVFRAYFDLGGYGGDHIAFFTLRLTTPLWVLVTFSLNRNLTFLFIGLIYAGLLFHPTADSNAKSACLWSFLFVSVMAVAVSEVNRKILQDILSESRNSKRMLDETTHLNLALYSEVRERRRAEALLVESEQKSRSLYNSSPLGIGMTDLRGRVTDVNPALLDMTGYALDEIKGRPLLDFIAPCHKNRMVGYVERLRKVPGIHPPFEFDLVRKNGVFMPVSARGWIVVDQKGEPRAVGGFIKDLTAEKRLEQEKLALENRLRQSQRLEAIGTLAGGIAHDFNNILGVIIGQTELMELLDVEKQSPVHQRLGQVKQAAYRAADLVGQILTFSRTAGSRKQAIDPRPLVKETVRFMRATLPSSIAIRETYRHQNATIWGDPTQIHQVLMNLCTNAGHAMKKTGGVLDILLSKVDLDASAAKRCAPLSPGRYVEMVVGDTGHGIDQTIIGKIFDPFFTTKGDDEGTGLGLSVVHGIVSAHGGAVLVDSEPGGGATFRVLFPEHAPVDKKTDAAAGGKVQGGDERLLFVDDEAALVDIGRGILEHLGYRVVTQTDSLQALSVFSAAPDQFDLIITDMNMPAMTGIELAKACSRIRSDIPVVLSTGFAKGVTREVMRRAGICECVAKPLNLLTLSTVVRKVLDDAVKE